MSPKVRCYFEGITRFTLQRDRLNHWIARVAGLHGATLKSVRIIFCTDSFLLSLNQQYLQHDTFTDIITFPFNEPGKPIEGELYISVDRIKENAARMNIPWLEELDRVIIHGVLHLLGFGDETRALKQEMRLKEDNCLTLRDKFPEVK